MSRRTLDIVRAKMKRLGLIKRISHFNPTYGHESGWVFCNRLLTCLSDLRAHVVFAQEVSGRSVDEKKDRDCVFYI